MRFKLFLGIWVNDYLEEGMDGQLREILCEEGDEAHKFTKDQRLPKEIERVIDAERVNDSGQEHILSNERRETSVLQVRLIEYWALLDRLKQ